MDFEETYDYIEDENFSDIEDGSSSEVDSEEESSSDNLNSSIEDEDSQSYVEDHCLELEEDHEDKRKKKKKYTGFPFLTKFEKTRVLGIRTEQIMAGAQVFVEHNSTDTPYEIAVKELNNKRMPLLIRRFFGLKYRDISVNSLKIIN